MLLDLLVGMTNVVPVLWQANLIESLLKDQIEMTDKAQVEVQHKHEFLRKVCHVQYFFNDHFRNYELRFLRS